MTRVIHAGDREFELPEFQIGDRVLWTVRSRSWRYLRPDHVRLPATVVAINLLAPPSARLQLWFDEDVRGLASGLVNGLKCPVDEVETMPVVEQLAERAP